MRRLVAFGALAAGIACGTASAFVCESDSECNAGGVAGVCQSGGYCSFPDDDCASGQRYGEHVAVGLGGRCVPSGDDAADGSGSDTAETTSGDDDGISLDGASLDDSSLDGTSSGAVDPGTSTAMVGSDDGSMGSGDTSTGAPTELDPDLVLWLTFDDPQDPWVDASTYARDVVCDADASACPQALAGGPMELGAQFDGVDDRLQVAHDPALETDEGFTVVANVRNDALSTLAIRTVIARPYAVETENSWEIFFRDENADGVNDVVFEIADPGGQIQLIATPPVAKGEWVRLAAVWTVDSVALYFDGVLQASEAATGMLLDDSAIQIGGDVDNLLATHFFTGAIDDVRVYRRALSDTEIAALR